MDAGQVGAVLKDLPVGEIRCFEQIGSTNDEAARLVAQGAPHLTLVIAEEQTAGRGRGGNTWYSPAGASLAFSLILYPHHLEPYLLPRLTALGALAVKDALNKLYDLPAQIKWPNDVLVHRQKVCGVLAEAQFDGDQVKALVLGIGINVPAPAQVAILQIQSRQPV
jgi:BirA family biotin operon repressor/biotin-[acetyl-CoA-carboxylase] ligase